MSWWSEVRRQSGKKRPRCSQADAEGTRLACLMSSGVVWMGKVEVRTKFKSHDTYTAPRLVLSG